MVKSQLTAQLGGPDIEYLGGFPQGEPPALSFRDADHEDRILNQEIEYQAAIDHDSKNRSRAVENLKMYWGVDLGQWPDDIVAQYTQEQRQALQFNVACAKVDGLAGSIMKNPKETTFAPVEGDYDDLTLVAREALHSDKELMDWTVSDRECLLLGLIYQGCEFMDVARSGKASPLGNIRFSSLPPGTYTFSPRWITNNGADCKKAWRSLMYTPKEMAEIWPEHADFIAYAVNLRTRMPEEFGPNTGVQGRASLEDIWGSTYRIIEGYEIKKVKVVREIDLSTGLLIPDTDDPMAKQQWLQANNPSWEQILSINPGMFQMIEMETNLCYQLTTAPSFTRVKPFFEGLTEQQCGRIPLFPFSAARLNGECRGIIDLIKDAQLTINYRESLITYMIQTMAAGGELIDPMLFGQDAEKIKEYRRYKNNAAYVGETAPGALKKNLAPYKLRQGQISPDILNEINRMYDVIDRISKQPAAADSRTEHTGEPNVLYENKLQQAELALYILLTFREQHLKEKCEAWLEQAKRTYGITDIPREFSIVGKKGKIIINEKVLDQAAGGYTIRNQIANISRHKVMITDSPDSLNNRTMNRAISMNMMNTLDPNINPGSRQFFAESFMKSLDNYGEADKQKIDRISGLEAQLAEETIQTNIFLQRQKRGAVPASPAAPGQLNQNNQPAPAVPRPVTM